MKSSLFSTIKLKCCCWYKYESNEFR